MKKTFQNFLFYGLTTVLVSFIIIKIMEQSNPWNGLYILFIPYAAILSGIIGALIGRKWNLKWIHKFLIVLLLIVPLFALVLFIAQRI